MTERWARTKELFNLALEQDPATRHALLLELCGADVLLRTDVESLLASHDRADSLLEGADAAPWSAARAPAMISRCVGDYRIIREAGRGGTSIVYLAERADQQYQKQVAIKMLQCFGASDELLQRFRVERQTLAQLDHPNIVTLLDAGSTEEGWPYLVMDFVEGVPIDAYCDDNALSITARLRIFRTVCDAVAYAHLKGVIHRDLKPSNILMRNDGAPRLLDFGIAKLRDPARFALTTLVTRSGMHAMTPEFASPEQVRGQPITLATDIYSLGILLYRILSGHHPFRTQERSLLELEHTVCEAEPAPPSVAAQRPTARLTGKSASAPPCAPQDWASAHHTGAADLGRSLRGDLDAIVMKAISKEPQRRYLSAADFSDDIGRYLAGLSVRARRPSVLYRSGKFITRHRESILAATIVVALVSGVAVWQAGRWQRPDAGRGAGNARVFSRSSVAVLGFRNLSQRADTAWLSTAFSELLTTELAAGGELRTLPGETVARAKIELSLADVETLSTGALKDLRRNLGSDFVVLGSYLSRDAAPGERIRIELRLQDTASGKTLLAVADEGTELQLFDVISRTGAQLRRSLGASQVSQAESARIAATVPASREGARLYSQGLAKLRQFDVLAARNLLSQAVLADATFPLAHAALAKTWLALGYDSNARQEARTALETAGKLSREQYLLVEGYYYETSKDWGRSVEAYRTLFNFFPDNPEYGLALANVQIAAGQGKEAMVLLARLRGLSAAAQADPRIDLAQAYAASAISDNSLQKIAAQSAADKAGTTGAKLLVAAARVLQCRALANVGSAAQSDAACEEARAIYEAVGDWAGAARALHNMAELPLNRGELRDAQALYARALVFARRVGDERGIARELGNLGVVFAAQGQFVKAEEFDEDSLAAYRKIGHTLGVAGEGENIAQLLRSQGRADEALVKFKDSLSLAREIENPDLQALDLRDIGDVLADQGDLRGAAESYDQALRIQRQIGERSYYAESLVASGRVRAQQGDTAGARAAYAEAQAIQEELGEKGSLALTQIALANLACDASQAEDAASLARGALRELQAEQKASDEVLAWAVLARALLRQEQIPAARAAIIAAAPAAERASVLDKFVLTLLDARVQAAEGNTSGAEDTARRVLAAADNLRLVRVQFEAALVLGEIQAAGRNATSARAELARLQVRAQDKGFRLIACKAALARGGGASFLAPKVPVRMPQSCRGVMDGRAQI